MGIDKKPGYIKAMGIHVDNCVVGEVDAIDLTIYIGDEKAILTEF